jgi:hypothetical protein
MIHRNDPYCILSQVAASTESLLAWKLGPRNSDRGGQDKANWRSRTRRRWAIDKPLSAHWFLEALRLALNDIRLRPDGAFQLFRRISASYGMALAIFNSNVSAFHSIAYALLRLSATNI